LIIHLKSDWYGYCHLEPVSLFSSDLCHETKYFWPQNSPRGDPRRSAVSEILSPQPVWHQQSFPSQSHLDHISSRSDDPNSNWNLSAVSPCLKGWLASHMIDWLDMNATSKCTHVTFYGGAESSLLSIVLWQNKKKRESEEKKVLKKTTTT
jgi:hypothetical protein